MLVKRYKVNAKIRKALKPALNDPSWEMVFEALRSLGDEGLGYLVRKLSEEAPDQWKKSAIQALARIENPTVLPLMRTALLREDTVTAAAEALGRFRDRESVQPLIEIVKDIRFADGKIAVVKALGEIADPRANDFLLDLLKDPDPELPELRLAVVTALGTCGTIRAVEPLYELTRPVFGGDVKSAARYSIAQIQARLGPKEQGALSLAEDALLEGALSVAEESEKDNKHQAEPSTTREGEHA